MSFDETKNRIRHRRYSELRRRGEPIPPDLAEHFIVCPSCRGRGTFGYSTVQNGGQVEVDDVCAKCNGESFALQGSA
jgi:DnaJ-class molecular chaperone